MRLVIFGAVLFAISFLVYVFPVNVIAHLLIGREIFAPTSLIPAAIIAAAVSVYFRTHITSPLLSGLIYYGMGIGFIGLWVTITGLLAARALPEFSVHIGQICLFLTLVLSLKAIVNGRQIHIAKIDITSAKIKQRHNLLFISDVHLGSNPTQHLAKVCDKMAGLDFDALLIGGDLFDSSAFTASDLDPLKAIEKPILFVTGNHEYYVKDHQHKVADLAAYNITVLDNQSVQSGELHIVGISDQQSPKRQSEIAKQQVRPDRFNLLMVHQPSIFETAPDDTDLMLSGHTHNGQIFPFSFLVRLQFKTVYGLYKRLNSRLYVSSGCGTWGPRMRLGTRNEIVQITISPQRVDR
ncbi:metallophosphoesterase [Alphaproteobacteria bacterium]|nr:metallophosphoesterase [Alphaproteobacteria bacterium]